VDSPRVERQENHADLAAKYASTRAPVVRTLVRRTLGTDLANGYTTVEHADDLVRLLALSPGDRLLDLGAGRGWPGVHLAEKTGCHLLSTDLTLEAVNWAAESVRAGNLRAEPMTLAADGTTLPFRAGVFNAVVHADVLC
jgi:ubiquinone/menaquinone biosynthesis C-methylase UbiE